MPLDKTFEYIGYHSLDIPQTSKSKFWEQVKWLLAYLYKEYPHEMIELEMTAKMHRELGFSGTKEGIGDAKGLVPPRLNMWLVKVYPGEKLPYPDRKTFWNEFYRRYPIFSYSNK